MIPKSKDSSIPGFEQWFLQHQDEVNQVYSILAEQLSDNPAVLAGQLTGIESWHGRMTKLLAESNAYLDLAERAVLSVRGDKWTDLDRKANQVAAVAQERKVRNMLDGICKSISARLMLGMSLAKRNAGERTDWNG